LYNTKGNNKLDAKSIKTIFLGYSSEKRDTNIMTKKIINSIFQDMCHFWRMNPTINQPTNQMALMMMYKINP
jgi:hypothetical protein